MALKFPVVSEKIKTRAHNLQNANFKYRVDFLEHSIDDDYVYALVETTYTGSRLYYISFYVYMDIETREITFEEYECTCPHDVYVCKHMYAAMINLMNDYDIYMQFHNYADQIQDRYDDDMASAFSIDKHRSMLLILEAIDQKIDTVEKVEYELTPEFIIDEDEIHVKFKVGVINQKKYVVKDIYKFIDLFEMDSEYELSAGNLIKCTVSKFTNKKFVREVIEIISNADRTISNVSAKGKTDWYGYYSPGKVYYEKKSCQLSKKQFISLLMHMQNQSVKVKYEVERMANYAITSKSNKYQLQSSEKNGVVLLSSKTPLVCICDDERVAVIDFIFNTINVQTIIAGQNSRIINALINKTYEIDKDNAQDFYDVVISQVDKYIDFNYDFSRLLKASDYVGIKTHIDLIKSDLFITFTTNCDDDETDYLINELQVKLLNGFLKIYDQEEFYVDEVSTVKISGLNNIIDFVNDKLAFIKDFSEKLTSNEAFKNFKIVTKVPIQTKVKTHANSTILNFSSSQFTDSELLEILRSSDLNEKYLPLASGKIIDLNSEDVKKVIKNANDLDLKLEKAQNLDFEIELASIFYYNKMFEALDITNKSDDLIEGLILDYNQIESKEATISSNVVAELRNYQKIGINWLSFLHKYNFGGILADDMGLGKTLQVITHLSSIKSNLPTLIITPASLIYNWKYEFAKFTKKSDIIVLDGTAAARRKMIDLIKKQIVIVSYDSFKRDFEKIAEYKFNYVILDEAQHTKNANTKIAKAVKAIDSEHRLALTGTPIENNLNDLWSLFDFILPGLLGSAKEFKQNYIRPIENGNKTIQENLKRKVSPFILRRLKTEVLSELPTKSEKIVHIKMDEKQQKLYDAQALLIKQFLDKTTDDELKKKQIEILAMITKLRQIACNPKLTFAEYKGGIAKQEYLISHLETLIANDHKTVVFSQFTSNFDYLQTELESAGIEYYKITGATPKEKRYELVEAFNNNSIPVFLISLKAGGTGLNIVGADTVIHFDPWWNTAAQNQATDRVHRMGQTKNVFVYKLICENTIEEQIVKLQEKKQKLAEELLEADTVTSSSLTKDDLFNLF